MLTGSLAPKVVQEHRIADGPAVLELLFALGHGDTKGQHWVTFYPDVPGHVGVRVRIIALEREDGSGRRWIYRGYDDRNYGVGGWYDSGSRLGLLSITRR